MVVAKCLKLQVEKFSWALHFNLSIRLLLKWNFFGGANPVWNERSYNLPCLKAISFAVSVSLVLRQHIDGSSQQGTHQI